MPTRKTIGRIVLYNNFTTCIEIQYDGKFCERFCDWFIETEKSNDDYDKICICRLFLSPELEIDTDSYNKYLRHEDCINTEKYITGNFNVYE